MKHSVFCPHFFDFWGTSQADCGVGDCSSPSPRNTFPVYTSTWRILADFINVYHRNFCREHFLPWLRDCWSSQSGGAPDFSNSPRHGPNQLHIMWYYIMAWLSSSGHGVIWRLQCRARRQWQRRVLNYPTGLLRAEIDQIPVSIIFDVIVRTAFF